MTVRSRAIDAACAVGTLSAANHRVHHLIPVEERLVEISGPFPHPGKRLLISEELIKTVRYGVGFAIGTEETCFQMSNDLAAAAGVVSQHGKTRAISFRKDVSQRLELA